MTGLILLHGWGFAPDVWNGWAQAFPERPVALLDAGYFGPQRLELPHNPDGWVGIGHSMGFARLLAMDVPWKGLVGLGAFLRFCTTPEHASGTPPQTLDAMLDRLQSDPQDVLTRFMRRCGLKNQLPAQLDSPGCERLRQDLMLLRDLNLAAPAVLPPVLLLHAADDRIAPLALAEEARTQLPAARLRVFITGGHALPQRRGADCLALTREFLNATA